MIRKILALALAAAPALLQAATTATADVTAGVLPALAIGRHTHLRFGNLSPGTGGTLTVSPRSQVTVNGVQAAGGNPTAAVFQATGATGQTYSVAVPDHIDLTRDGGNETMRVVFNQLEFNNDNTIHDASTGAVDGTIGNSGNDWIRVGGTVTVARDQAVGNYAGQFTITVNHR